MRIFCNQTFCTFLIFLSYVQGCRLPHARTSVACWNDVGRIRLTCSQARLACSYLTKAQQPSGLDFAHWNRTQVNTCCLLLFIFCSLPSSSQGQQPRFRDQEFPSMLERIRFTSCRCCNQPPAKKQCAEKRKAHPEYEKEKTNRKWQDSLKWAASD